MHTVFVYGTLKSGYGNNRLLRTATKLGEAVSEDYFLMKETGFPVIFPSDQEGNPLKGKIKGELWEVDDETLERLDMLESNGTLYQREVRRFINQDAELMDEAWIYIGHINTWRRMGNYPNIEPQEEGLLIWGQDRHREVA